MGFYGNITNVNKTTFTFDKIYPNRKEMDENCANDGIFIGRYVLIEYDTNADTFFPRVYKQGNKFYTSFNYEEETRVRFSETQSENDNAVTLDTIVYVLDGTGQNATRTFYKCIDKVEENGIIYAIFEETTLSSEEADPYLQNYLIDSKAYPDMKRGYDSTVWQKVFDEGFEKYVNIAELNSVVPTFDLTVDAPTQFPLTPHFDADSTDVYYKLHVQPQWGFKVAHASPSDINNNSKFETTDKVKYPSNEKVSYTREWYDPKFNIKETITEDYNAAIYYNKEGFLKETRNYYDKEANDSTIKEDTIKILPTGKSGMQYNMHDKNNPSKTEIAVDTQELSILLPSIGNAISDMWDIIYNNPGNGNNRNTNVEWGSTQGVRMVNINEDGYTYEPKKTETLAGAINSVHDLMGMIIDDKYKAQNVDNQDKTSEEYKKNVLPLLKQADANKIYYINGKYYMKTKGYDWVEYNGNNQYKEINLADTYDGNDYYHKTIHDDYELSTTTEAIDGVVYYDIDMEELYLDPPYQPNKYYYIDENGNYLIDKNDVAGSNRKYYKFINNTQQTTKDKYFFIKQPHIENANTGLKKGLFYNYTEIDATGKTETVERACDNTSTIEYNEIKTLDPFIAEYTEQAEFDPQKGEIVHIYDFRSRYPVELIQWDSNQKYYTKNDSAEYTFVKELPSNYYYASINYYTIEIPENSNVIAFYEGDKYYYTTPSDIKNYRFSSMKELYNNNYTYYILKSEKEFDAFYEPNKYYYNENEKYILDTASNKTDGRVYYEFSEIYVHPESKNLIFTPCSLWNVNVIVDKDDDDFKDLKLGCRFNSWKWKELEGFAKNINTIHSLILEVNNILQNDDIETRESDSVQGCINTLNDIIHKINYLKPAEFMIVDECGIMTSSPWTTKQIFNSQNYGTGNITADIEDENMWIKLEIDDSHKNPMIAINHTYHPVGVTTTISDKNTGIKNENAGINNNTNDTIELYTPIVDNMGHIVGDNTERVTLPYGYKTIKTNGRGNAENENATSIPGTADIVADSTQDVLTINSGNKWMRIDSDSGNDTITISHDIHEVDGAAADPTDLNDGTDTITIQDINFDTAGHVISNKNHTYTLPFGYKSFKDSEENPGQTDAETTQSIMTLIGDDWIKPTVSAQDTLKYEHIGPVESNEVKSEDADKTPLFGETFDIEDWYFDEKGHKSNRLTHTVKIPVGSLEGTASTNAANVLTSIDFTPSTGAIKTTHENLSQLTLTGYEKINNNADVSAEDTLSIALSKLQTKIIEEENTRNGVVNDVNSRIDQLDYEDENLIKFISKITQAKGKISVERSAAGTLILSDSTENIATQNALRILGSDSIETAFGKVEAQVVKENTDRVAAINSINNALNLLNSDASTAGSVANTATSVAAAEIAKIVANADASYDTLKEIADWILSDTTGAAKMNADIGTNTTNIALNTAAIELLETSTVSIATYEAKITELEQEILTVNSRCNLLDKEVKNLINKVAELEAKLNS